MSPRQESEDVVTIVACLDDLVALSAEHGIGPVTCGAAIMAYGAGVLYAAAVPFETAQAALREAYAKAVPR